MLPSIEQRIATELNARPAQVAAAIQLIDEGATVPFIARYRKEATGNLDDTQLRLLDERLSYLRELKIAAARFSKALKSRASSRRNWRLRLPLPRPSSAWRICICPISQSAAPRRKWRVKPAWNPWPMRW